MDNNYFFLFMYVYIDNMDKRKGGGGGEIRKQSGQPQSASKNSEHLKCKFKKQQTIFINSISTEKKELTTNFL
jgi:hypothetical protein